MDLGICVDHRLDAVARLVVLLDDHIPRLSPPDAAHVPDRCFWVRVGLDGGVHTLGRGVGDHPFKGDIGQP